MMSKVLICNFPTSISPPRARNTKYRLATTNATSQLSSSPMASTSPSLLLVHSLPRRTAIHCLASSPPPSPPSLSRRRSLLLLAAPFLAAPVPALAQDIPLFGLRKRLQVIEKDAEEIVKEGEKIVEEGIEAAGKEIEVVEKEIDTAKAGVELGIELGLGGDLAQVGAVAAAEVVGVLAAVSVVNGILGPES
ncbi:hypothetical protein IHE45_01G010800 [Dioscorea alata]|uniref:Uncharacterized protein n=1 Tax=Dioscorea alata TaxID=55571 RepID=A0ACB7WS72_DIOAL|nr:hypothetical protein IHE45_01G010800 [Dioscorea alata]